MTFDFSVETVMHDDTFLLRLSGFLDCELGKHLDQMVDEWVKKGTSSRLTMDCSRLTGANSQGLGYVFYLSDRIAKVSKPPLQLFGVPDFLETLIIQAGGKPYLKYQPLDGDIEA